MLACLVSGLIFIITFVLILSEKVHRTIAALGGAVLMVLAGNVLGFYPQEKALKSVDFNTIGLLFGMMVIVVLLERTGFFQYLAIITAKKTKGNPWYLLVALGTVTTIASMFLDNVTTVVLIAPVTILLAELLGINPVPLLVSEALLSNIGGIATLVGDPPNILIGSAGNISFNSFLLHLGPIVLITWAVCLILIKFIFKKELALPPKNIDALLNIDENETLRDPVAMKKILITLGLVIFLFFVHAYFHLKPSFVAILGCVFGLLWVRADLNEVLRKIEWGVLLFFAGLFVCVGGIESAGLLEVVSCQVVGLAKSNILLTCITIIWVGAIFSSIVDNIPFTMAMIPIILYLKTQGIDVSVLWWALALGVGLGGNGTIIGATANVIVVSLSEKTKTPITSRIWLKAGLPVMLVSLLVATVFFIVFFGFMRKL